eukprot:2899306-Rhodomonas_salina.2
MTQGHVTGTDRVLGGGVVDGHEVRRLQPVFVPAHRSRHASPRSCHACSYGHVTLAPTVTSRMLLRSRHAVLSSVTSRMLLQSRHIISWVTCRMPLRSRGSTHARALTSRR